MNGRKRHSARKPVALSFNRGSVHKTLSAQKRSQVYAEFLDSFIPPAPISVLIVRSPSKSGPTVSMEAETRVKKMECSAFGACLQRTFSSGTEGKKGSGWAARWLAIRFRKAPQKHKPCRDEDSQGGGAGLGAADAAGEPDRAVERNVEQVAG